MNPSRKLQTRIAEAAARTLQVFSKTQSIVERQINSQSTRIGSGKDSGLIDSCSATAERQMVGHSKGPQRLKTVGRVSHL